MSPTPPNSLPSTPPARFPTTLAAWLDWQQRLHPKEMALGLERVREVWGRLHPQPFAPLVITVGGTNGKGSCVAYLEAMLGAAGHRVGGYTSPHLLRYNERVRLDGQEVGDAQLCAAFTAVEQARGAVALTYFEFGTLAALWLFSQAAVEVAVLEVGLGGRLDAVNLLDADLAILTTIDLDHTDWLGDTRGAIALEKAGILRPGRPAVFGGADIPAELLRYAEERGVPLRVAGQDYGWREQGAGWCWQGAGFELAGLPLPALIGRFQLANAAAVITGLHLLGPRLPVGREAIVAGLRGARLAGRFQVLSDSGGDGMAEGVEIVLDVAHNPEAAAALAENLRRRPVPGRTLGVCAMLKDKDAGEVARRLAHQVEVWFLAGLAGERGQQAEALAARWRAAGIDGARLHACNDVATALRQAQQAARSGDRILVCGSFLTVAAVIEALRPGRG
jgi:dihydrofolate synthase / folylpolyglutamate synthase